MNFIESIQNLGLGHMLETHPMKVQFPTGSKKILTFFDDIVKNNRRVLIDPDMDPDGMISGMLVRDTLELLGHKNYFINRESFKRHNIDDSIIKDIRELGIDYLIVLDSSTNMMELFHRLIGLGVKIIVIDHHIPEYTMDEYPAEVAIVNPKLTKSDYSKASAGYVTAIVMLYILSSKKIEFNWDEFCVWAYLTLYSDSCDLTSPKNIELIQRVQGLPEDKYPELVRDFMTEWDSLNRNYVSFNLIPRVNAIIRLNYMDLVYDLFFNYKGLDEEGKFELRAQVEENYLESKEIQEFVVNHSEKYVEVVGEFAYLDIDKMSEYIDMDLFLLHNYTGIIANKLSGIYGKASLVTVSKDAHTLKGSVRDPYSRDLLKLFSTGYGCGGHNSAFGLSVFKMEQDKIVPSLKRYSRLLKNESMPSYIAVDMDELDGVTFKYLTALMADYNELAGVNSPVAMITKKLDLSFKISRYEKYVRIFWNDISMISFIPTIEYGNMINIKPVKKREGCDYIVSLAN